MKTETTKSAQIALVIDDEPQIRRLLRVTLEANGYRVFDAATGNDGVAQAAQRKPDVVLLDLGLPDLDGLTVLKRIREWSKVPVLDIDANGILNVQAKDKATGKEQKIVIKASSGLNEEEIKRMVRDAEAHAEEDKKFRELAETRNRADALLHAAEKSLKDLGDKVAAAERAKVESAISDLRGVIKGDDKDVIETKARALAEASATIAQQAYASAQPEGGASGGPGATPGGKDEVLDAEFEEVKDKDGKAN